MKKPVALYHASSNRSIQGFEPRAESVRDTKEGPRVFATPFKAVASFFLVPIEGSLFESGIFSFTKDGELKRFFYWVCGDRKRFEELDHGGAIYKLPINTFECEPDKGLGEFEWTSKVAVKPISKKVYKSGLEAMLLNGVNVFFVDPGTFKRIQQSSDHGRKILSRAVSENQKRGIAAVFLN